MSMRGLFQISLAAKCRLLFGLAVVLIIGAALFVPWRTLETMVRDRNIQRTRAAALIAYAWMDPTNRDWASQQDLLNQWWADNARLLDLPSAPPRLILLPTGEAAGLVRYRTLVALRRPALWTAAGVRKLMTLALPFDPLDALPLVWLAAPDGMRLRAQLAAHLLRARAIEIARTDYPFLDENQRKAIAAMKASESLTEFRAPDRRGESGTVHRYIVGVRRPEAQGLRRSLVGLIDVEMPAPQTDEAILFSRIVILLAGSLAGFLAILVFYLIVQKLILAPVRDLKKLALQIAGGDLTARSGIATGDEFEDLSLAFNDMLGQLESARVELEKINRSLDIRLGELAESNVALYESNRLKSEFIANVSHELRTPLTSIIGFADLLRDAAQSPHPVDMARYARYAHNILTSGRMLLDIINDLLDLAKIEAGKVELHRQNFFLRDVCEDLADFMRPMVDKKGQTLVIDLDEDTPMMNSDPGKIRQVLYNLLSNANKYTPEGGTVRLEVQRPDEDHVRLIVEDNGPGIAPEDQQRIFEKFRQLDSSVTREHSGTGLGLAISRELCAMLGGTISLESEPGLGARFTVELPLESPETAHRPLPSLT